MHLSSKTKTLMTLIGIGCSTLVLAQSATTTTPSSTGTPTTTGTPAATGAPATGGAPGAGAGPALINSVFYDQNIKVVTAVTEVFGDGQRTTAAIVEYKTPIKNSGLSKTTFTVPGRTITKVYANDKAAKAATGKDGRFVILELSPTDAGAPTYSSNGPVLMPASLGVNQVTSVQTVAGTSLAPTKTIVANTRQTNLIVDDFQQFKFTDPVTGLVLAYNLYIPKNYDAKKKYPMVLFMPDLGVTNINPYTTLVQGLGATVWASPEDQAKYPSFVLAPVYPATLANDNNQTSEYADITVRLIHALEGKYALDSKRLYTTGQSGGCLTSIALDIKYPNLFAASLLVAGQWDATKVGPMANDKLWIIVSQDDDKAFPGMNAITAQLKKDGAKVTSAVWNGNASAAEFKTDVAAMLKAGPDSNVHYVSFAKGTVIPAGASTQGAAGHRNTWRVAYTITGVRDWLFQQHQ